MTQCALIGEIGVLASLKELDKDYILAKASLAGQERPTDKKTLVYLPLAMRGIFGVDYRHLITIDHPKRCTSAISHHRHGVGPSLEDIL